MRLIFFGLSLFIFFVNACCSSSEIKKDTDITVLEINCWLNLMPGGEPSFHYSGTLAINKEYSDKFKFLSVQVFYKDELIHQSQPLIHFFDEVVTDTTSIIKFNFYSEQGIKVTDKMMKAERVNFHLLFELGDDTLEKHLSDVSVTRAY